MHLLWYLIDRTCTISYISLAAFINVCNRKIILAWIQLKKWNVNDMQSKIQLKSGIDAKVCFACFIILTNIVLRKHMHYVYFCHI